MSIRPFHFGVGDHRAYAVEFQMKIMLGDLSIPLCSPNKRRLTCSFTIIFQRCLERSETQFTLHKIPFKIQQLKEPWHTLDPLLIEIRLNRIDEFATDLLINAGKSRKFRTGEVAYSPETDKARKTWHFWKLLETSGNFWKLLLRDKKNKKLPY